MTRALCDTVATTAGGACYMVAVATAVSGGATEEDAGLAALFACAPAVAAGQCNIADDFAAMNDEDDSTDPSDSCKSSLDAVASPGLLTQSGTRFACGVPCSIPQAGPA